MGIEGPNSSDGDQPTFLHDFLESFLLPPGMPSGEAAPKGVECLFVESTPREFISRENPSSVALFNVGAIHWLLSRLLWEGTSYCLVCGRSFAKNREGCPDSAKGVGEIAASRFSNGGSVLLGGALWRSSTG